MKNLIAFTLAAALPLLNGCGPFALARKPHPRNSEAAESKCSDECVVLGLAILNVYAISALADAIVLNSRQSWSGRGPVPPPRTTRAFTRGDAMASITFDPAIPSLRLVQRYADGPERVLELRRIKEGVVGLDGTGRIILYSQRIDGRVVVSDNEAHVIRVYEANEAARLGRPAGLAARY